MDNTDSESQPPAPPSPPEDFLLMSSQAPAILTPKEVFRLRVEQAITTHVVDLTWTQDKSREPKPLSVDDLVEVVLIIHCDGNPTYHVPKGIYKRKKQDKIRWKDIHPGLTVERLRKSLGCHRAKANKLLKILLAIELIEKVANYYKGKRGNIYRVVAEGKRPSPPPKSWRQQAKELPPRPLAVPQPHDMDDPFA